MSRFYQVFTMTTAVFFYFVFRFQTHNDGQQPWKRSQQCTMCFDFLYPVPLCIFRVLLKNKTNKKNILEWMQICNCAFLYRSVWWNVGSERCINNDTLAKVDRVCGLRTDWKIHLHIFGEIPWCQGLLGGQSNVSEPTRSSIFKWLMHTGVQWRCWSIHS